ncbi:hypothetical protein [Euzebya rosea]|uniref:hypothetical protein n=1 Tax=Euzebya rosea TaxID=2052804 RepID=UPI001300870B|nr:hypothetical protein [Euzebya rosea]
MPEHPTPRTYEIVLRGRVGPRLLRPLLDDFTVDHPEHGRTRLVGEVRDPGHLHGVLAHLTAFALEVDSVSATPSAPPTSRSTPITQEETS